MPPLSGILPDFRDLLSSELAVALSFSSDNVQNAAPLSVHVLNVGSLIPNP